VSADHARTAVWASLIALLGTALASCVIPAFDPTAHGCPCLPGSHCDEPTGQCVPGPPSTLSPIDDTYVRGGIHEYEAHGDEERLVCIMEANVDYLRIVYVKFDLQSLLTPVDQATLVLHGTYGQNAPMKAATFTAYVVADDGWSAATLTYATRPADGAELGSYVRRGNGAVELDVTSWINTEIGGDRLAGIMVQQTADPDYWEFRSSRYGIPEQRPVLRLASPAADDGGVDTAPAEDAPTAD
jgi:hypothetical protein